MPNILILGAAGSLARVAIEHLLSDTDANLTLFLRNSKRLQRLESARVRLVEGDVTDTASLTEAMQGQDVVYANLAGDLPRMASSIVHAMQAAKVRRLIFISSMGIYDEVPGERYRSILDPYRDSAQLVEQSDLDYTILRPSWFTNDDEVDYVTTQKGEPFRGRVVSRNSIADLIVKLALDPHLEVRKSLGVSKV